MKNNNIFTSKDKLFISQDSMKDEIKDKNIELEPKDNEKDKINNENKQYYYIIDYFWNNKYKYR